MKASKTISDGHTAWDRIPGMLPETILPVQFHVTMRGNLPGGKRLILAVFEEAMDTLVMTAKAHGRRADRLWNEVVDWVLAERTDYGSFLYCCQVLGLQEKAVQKVLRDKYGLAKRGVVTIAVPHYQQRPAVRYTECVCTKRLPSKLKIQFADGFSSWVPVSVVRPESEIWTVGDRGQLIVDARWAKKVFRLRWK